MAVNKVNVAIILLLIASGALISMGFAGAFGVYPEWLPGPQSSTSATWIAPVGGLISTVAALLLWKATERLARTANEEKRMRTPELELEVVQSPAPSDDEDVAIAIRLSNHGMHPVEARRIRLKPKGGTSEDWVDYKGVMGNYQPDGDLKERGPRVRGGESNEVDAVFPGASFPWGERTLLQVEPLYGLGDTAEIDLPENEQED